MITTCRPHRLTAPLSDWRRFRNIQAGHPTETCSRTEGKAITALTTIPTPISQCKAPSVQSGPHPTPVAGVPQHAPHLASRDPPPSKQRAAPARDFDMRIEATLQVQRLPHNSRFSAMAVVRDARLLYERYVPNCGVGAEGQVVAAPNSFATRSRAHRSIAAPRGTGNAAGASSSSSTAPSPTVASPSSSCSRTSTPGCPWPSSAWSRPCRTRPGLCKRRLPHEAGHLRADVRLKPSCRPTLVGRFPCATNCHVASRERE